MDEDLGFGGWPGGSANAGVNGAAAADTAPVVAALETVAALPAAVNEQEISAPAVGDHSAGQHGLVARVEGEDVLSRGQASSDEQHEFSVAAVRHRVRP